MRSYLFTDSGLTLVIDGKTFTLAKDSLMFKKVIDALKQGASDQDLLALTDVSKAICLFSDGNFTLFNDAVTYKGQPVEPVISRRILQGFKEGIPFGYLLKFIENLAENPSKRSVEQLYPFLEHKNIPINEDGHLVAYKAIRNNWTDKHTGKFSNKIGTSPEMQRNQVCDDADLGCSYGFHIGSLEYVQEFACSYGHEGGDRIVIVTVNPKDIVSVPKDSSYQKVRTCKYKVIQEFTGALPNSGVKRDLSNAGKDDDEDIFDDEDESEEIYTQEDLDKAVNEAQDKALEDMDEVYKQAKEDAKAEILNSLKHV